MGKLDLDFKIRISDLQTIAKSENGFQRWDIWFLHWEIRKRIWKTVLQNSGLARARLAKRRPLFTRIVLQILSERWKGNPWNPDLDFLIEIHPEDGFLGEEIRFRIKSKSGFPNRTHPKKDSKIDPSLRRRRIIHENNHAHRISHYGFTSSMVYTRFGSKTNECKRFQSKLN